jgi:2-haloacid dehalogenase
VDGYLKPIVEVAQGLRPWEKVDAFHERKLRELIEQYHITMISDEGIEQLNLEWHRLKPWPDALSGLRRLKKKMMNILDEVSEDTPHIAKINPASQYDL